MKKKLILLELNEINFDVARYYIDIGIALPSFSKIFQSNLITTTAEADYENLEPWIQWPSIHTGRTYSDHRVFRLGDFVNSGSEQFFEILEKDGFVVGAVSPMNASNRLKKPAYFIPDPWTKTQSDGSFFSRALTSAIVQAVNDNSQSKLSVPTMMSLGLAFFVMVRPSRFISLIKYALSALGKSWRKALFLDMLLYEFHRSLFKRKNPNFSVLFLNAGAHIQHHYFYNSGFVNSSTLKNPTWYIGEKEDPVLEMLKVYDDLLQDLLNLKNTEVIIATGLSQKPYEELKFYYRLKDHAKFMASIGIDFVEVTPRMTRDFLVSFSSEEKALEAEKILASILVDGGIRLFEEIDNRGKDIFIVLTYPSEITNENSIVVHDVTLGLIDYVTFVAIKNGEHQSKGFAYFSEGVAQFSPVKDSHVSELYKTVLNFFGTFKV